MRGFVLAGLMALMGMTAHAWAEELQEVPCNELGIRIADDAYSSECKAVERQESDGRWRQEVLAARNIHGMYIIEHTRSMTHRTHMAAQTPRSVIQAMGFREVENWSAEMKLEGFRANTFTGATANGASPLRCLAFTQSLRKQRLLGVYCTAVPNPLNEADAAEILQRIEVR